MSEYVLRIVDEPQAEALLTYLRSLNFVELLPKQTAEKKHEAINGMIAFLGQLPNRDDHTQEDVNRAMNQLRTGLND